jgi:hypothetical protein
LNTRERAKDRNAASVSTFLSKTDRMLRDADRSEPHMGVSTARDRVQTSLRDLNGRLVSVRAFIRAIELRKSRTELDPRIADAEMLPAKTALALAESLKGALNDGESERAFESSFPLRKLNVAIHTLSNLVTSDIVTLLRYPTGDESTALDLMRQREAQATSIHADVADAVAEVIDELGIRLPEPPSLKLPERATQS